MYPIGSRITRILTVYIHPKTSRALLGKHSDLDDGLCPRICSDTFWLVPSSWHVAAGAEEETLMSILSTSILHIILEVTSCQETIETVQFHEYYTGILGWVTSQSSDYALHHQPSGREREESWSLQKLGVIMNELTDLTVEISCHLMK